ncbi:peroxide stress protein YaaA [Flexithrix dorotheae]|uniref:peroxide stress protein YaaA n=1 Tax=Flexithrix dorotheae TaxID=70993 RepID=UPI00036C7D2F|nr:peroxide stress protein YaaA [Flexithrix dorotheae]
MLILISPAKTLDFTANNLTDTSSQPVFQEESEILIKKLRTFSRKKIGELMNISPQLAELNYDRYQNWSPEFKVPAAKQAVLAFKGDVYLGLQAETFVQEDFDFAQKHLRILSGLHGLLKPLDLIRPYRLEMGTQLPVRRKKNLYQFWGDKITDTLNFFLENEEEPVVINLASNEYFKSVNLKKLKATVITPVFKDFKNGDYKVLSFFAKKARGFMSAYAIKNKLTNPENLKLFQEEGYSYNDLMSNGNEWVFTRG